MFAALVICATSLAAGQTAPAAADFENKARLLTEYAEVKAKAGRGSHAELRLALWCEAHGLQAERLRHLATAVLIDPANTTARGLMGLVAYRGRWQSPEAVLDQLEADEATTAALAKYNARRTQRR